jgi:Protein of unknown function (DUF1353)
MPQELAAPERVLHLSQLSDPSNEEEWNRWVTTMALKVQADDLVDIKRGFQTDLASVPNIFSWFIPRAGRYARAAVMHDQLWKLCDDYAKDKDAQKPKYDRRQADEQFRIALEKAGVSLLRRRIMWAAVRLAAIATKPDRGDGWEADIPALLVLGAIAVPILVPPAVVISASNLAFYGLELVTARFDTSPSTTTPTLQTKT